MKKILLLIFTVLLLNSLKAQNGFETQLSIGLPGNTLSKDISSFNASLNLGYMFSIKKEDSEIEKLSFKSTTSFQYGVSTGYSYTIRDKIYDDLQLLPVSAVVRMYFIRIFSLGLGAGYAVGLKPNSEDGGVFAEATFGIGIPQGSIFFAVRGVNSDGGSEFEWATMSIGLRLLLRKR
ncbi:MAG: hypothetical protein ACI9DK_003249 [Vicingaceae bacterium]|jgi:hypothetical protein